jgi:vanillate O-demethylase monooxygenase subunit
MMGLEDYWQMAGWSGDIGTAPIARVILGKPVLLYRTDDGQVVALDDRCPHRFAPLHKGARIGDGIACAYHGLVFDAGGRCVHNPHGNHVISPLALVHAYPVAEHQGAVWIWCGAEASRADVPDHAERNPDSGFHTVTGDLRVDAHFTLVIDNLLDLTHAGYLHGTTVSVAASEAQPEVASGVENGVIFSRFVTRDVPPPGPFRAHAPHDRGDYHRVVRWYAPSIVKTTIGFVPTGVPLSEGAVFEGYHILTPEEDRTTNYYWSASRNFAHDDVGFDDALRQMVGEAFSEEDEPMIAACQRYMGTTDLFSLRPALLETDRASVLVHRKMQQLKIVAAA